eukprot:sb/3474893/
MLCNSTITPPPLSYTRALLAGKSHVMYITARIFSYRQIHSKPSGSGAKSPGSQMLVSTLGSILTHFLSTITNKLLGYFPVNLDQFAASGNKQDVNRSSGSCARALERNDPFLGVEPTPVCGDRTRCLCRQQI